MTVAERLKKKYGVTICKEEYWNPLRGRFCDDYRIYCADGNRWDTAGSLRECEKICKMDAGRLLKIKELVEGYKDV